MLYQYMSSELHSSFVLVSSICITKFYIICRNFHESLENFLTKRWGYDGWACSIKVHAFDMRCSKSSNGSFFCLKFKLGIKAKAITPWAPCSPCSIRYIFHYQESSHDARSFNSLIEILMEWYKNNFRGFRTSHCTLILDEVNFTWVWKETPLLVNLCTILHVIF